MGETTIEALVRLSRALARERAARRESELLLEGLELMTSWEGAPLGLFHELERRFRTLLEFEDVALFIEVRPTRLVRVAANASRLPRVWKAGALFERVLQGSVVLAHDTAPIEEWARVDGAVTSALHLPLAAAGMRGMLVLTHGELGHFGKDHRRLAMRFAPLASQALVQLELGRAQRAQDRLREAGEAMSHRMAVLEEATARLEVGVLAFSPDGALFHASSTAHALLDPVGGVASHASALREAVQAQDAEPTKVGERRFELESLTTDADTVLVLIWDVTTLTVQAQEQAALRERLHVLIQSLQAGVLVETAKRQIAVTNAAFCDLFGIPAPPEALEGADCVAAAETSKQLFADPEGWLARVDELLAAREPVVGEVISCADGRLLARDYVPIVVEGSYEGHLWQYRDVTERERYAQELLAARREAEKANEAKSRFLAMMSHDMRTPLNAILGISELLADDLGGTQRIHAQTVRRNGETLLGLIEDLLDLTRIEAGELALDPRPTDLPATVRHAVNLHAPRAAANGIALVLEMDDCAPAVSVDARRVEQIITNLVGNAVKFTERGAVRVAVSTCRRGDRLEVDVQVRDTGIGIPEHALQTIFEPFRQAESDTRRRFGGTGLGLAITHALVTGMGGALEVESTFGRGTTFHLHFEAPVARRRPETARAQVPLANAPTVLVVDNNLDARLYAQTVLERAGARVCCVADGSEVAAAVREDAPTVVLMDLDMQVMGGLEATRTLRHWERAEGRSPIPVVALSASADAMTREHCLGAGMNDFAGKPIRPAELIDLIRRHTTPPVVVVDDDADLRLLLERFLGTAGYRASSHADGSALLEMDLADDALVLIDRELGAEDGAEVAETLLARGHRGPVVILTGDGSAANRSRCVQAGAREVWTKPLSRAQLTSRVRAVLDD